jgi:hypothetical protein
MASYSASLSAFVTLVVNLGRRKVLVYAMQVRNFAYDPRCGKDYGQSQAYSF